MSFIARRYWSFTINCTVKNQLRRVKDKREEEADVQKEKRPIGKPIENGEKKQILRIERLQSRATAVLQPIKNNTVNDVEQVGGDSTALQYNYTLQTLFSLMKSLVRFKALYCQLLF